MDVVCRPSGTVGRTRIKHDESDERIAIMERERHQRSFYDIIQ